MKATFILYCSFLVSAVPINNSTNVEELLPQPITGPWTRNRIDEWIWTGMNPTKDILPDNRGTLLDHISDYHGKESVSYDYCIDSWMDYQGKLAGNPPPPPLTGPWTRIIIDAWISAGFHPTDDDLPDHRGSLHDHIYFHHGENSVLLDYCDESWTEFRCELDTIKHLSDDISQLQRLKNLNEKKGHRENTLLHLYCRSENIYVIPILWLIRFGANPDQANKVGITPRDLLKGKGLEALVE